MSGEFRSCCNCIDGVRVVHNTASACPCPCHKEETVKDKEFDLDETKKWAKEELAIAHDESIIPYAQSHIKWLIKEVERLRVFYNELGKLKMVCDGLDENCRDLEREVTHRRKETKALWKYVAKLNGELMGLKNER